MSAKTGVSVELVVGLIAAVVAIASAGIAYQAQTRTSETTLSAVKLQAQLQAEQERRRPFLEKQLAFYFEVSNLSAQISQAPAGAKRDAAIRRFWELYWGPLAVVEEPAVEDAMVQFGKAMSDPSLSSSLAGLSLTLAHACRDSLASQWGTNLGQLGALRTKMSAPEVDTDRFGGDYKDAPVNNFAECSNACRSEDKCQAVSYNNDSHQCWMKSSVPLRRASKNFSSGVKFDVTDATLGRE